MIIFLVVLGVLHLAGGLILWIGWRRAPEGREDATGFHLREPGEETKRRQKKR